MATDEITTIPAADRARNHREVVPSATRRLIDKARSVTVPSRAAVQEKAKQAGSHWVPLATGAVAVAGAATALILHRRRAAKARAARRWRPGFLNR